MKKAVFRIEIYGDNNFEGFTNGETWNGWACPYFTFQEAQKIVDAHRKTGQNAQYDEDSEAFLFEVQNEEEFYLPLNVEGRNLYSIGYSSWIWEESDAKESAII